MRGVAEQGPGDGELSPGYVLKALDADLDLGWTISVVAALRRNDGNTPELN